jgi:hypothetical protein
MENSKTGYLKLILLTLSLSKTFNDTLFLQVKPQIITLCVRAREAFQSQYDLC